MHIPICRSKPKAEQIKYLLYFKTMRYWISYTHTNKSSCNYSWNKFVNTSYLECCIVISAILKQHQRQNLKRKSLSSLLTRTISLNCELYLRYTLRIYLYVCLGKLYLHHNILPLWLNTFHGNSLRLMPRRKLERWEPETHVDKMTYIFFVPTLFSRVIW